MLCPQCGNEVGEKIRLCDDCQAKRQARLAAERQQAEDAAKPPKKEVNESAEVPKPKRFKLALGLGVLLVLSVAGVKILKKQTPPPTPPVEVTSPDVPDTQFNYLGNVRGGIRFDKEEIHVTKAISAYLKRTKRLEIAFFRAFDRVVEPRSIRRREKLDEISGLVPDAVLSISFKAESEVCNLQNVAEYELRVYKNDTKLNFPGNDIRFPVKQLGGALSSGINTALETMLCSFKEREKIVGNFRGTKLVPVRDESKSLSWELDFDVPLIAPGTNAEVGYESHSAKTTVALWNPQKSALDIGFFGDELSNEEKEKLRSSASLLSLEAKHPDAVLSFGLPTGQAQLQREQLKTFGVTFYRDGKESLEFPGFEKQVGLFYVGNANGAGKLEGLGGALKPNSTIAGLYAHTVTKKVAGLDVAFSWSLAFQTPVLDVTAAASVPESAGAEDMQFGKVSCDSALIRPKAAVVLFYAQSNSLALGLYSDELNEEERQEALKRKTLTTYINRKRPVMVLSMDFDEGAKVSDPLQFRAYTAYFYREVGGSMQFPGFHDVVTIKRLAEQLGGDEVVQFSGDPRHDSKIRMTLKGRGSPSSLQTLCTWDFAAEVKPLVVQ